MTKKHFFLYFHYLPALIWLCHSKISCFTDLYKIPISIAHIYFKNNKHTKQIWKSLSSLKKKTKMWTKPCILQGNGYCRFSRMQTDYTHLKYGTPTHQLPWPFLIPDTKESRKCSSFLALWCFIRYFLSPLPSRISLFPSDLCLSPTPSLMCLQIISIIINHERVFI